MGDTMADDSQVSVPFQIHSLTAADGLLLPGTCQAGCGFGLASLGEVEKAGVKLRCDCY